MVNDFLVEIGSEELPSGAVLPLAKALTNALTSALGHANISYAKVQTFATPRRLAVLVLQVQSEAPPKTICRRGPAVQAAYDEKGQATQALLGFAKSCGVSIDALSLSKTDKGEWLVYETLEEGVKTKASLPNMLQQIMNELPIAKPMRWGKGEILFARPVHWIVMLWGNEVLKANLLGVNAGGETYGHRFHAPAAIKIDEPKEYEACLEKAFVIANFDKRRSFIAEQVNSLACQHKALAIMPDDLLDEVSSIVEWPEALLVPFEEKFLQVPQEALVASMQVHQKCFPLTNEQGALLPYFITVANIKSTHPEQVIAGNAKVMRARLSDAAFFFEKDKKYPLSHYRAMSGNVIFQAKLGTLLEKTIRLETLIQAFAKALSIDLSLALRAAYLSKCDLMTGMVSEFPELQGIMGYYYALHQDEDRQVSVAIKDHYLPRFAADQLPETRLGAALSLADRIDTLVGIFALSQKPSGDKDPFKLRRHALAIARILINLDVSFNLSTLLGESAKTYEAILPAAATIIKEVHVFILERLQAYYHAKGITVDVIQAVRAREENDLNDLDHRVHALAAFMKCQEAQKLSAACKRVNNLLENGDLNTVSLDGFQEAQLLDEAEKTLFAHMNAMEKMLPEWYEKKEYATVLTQLATLQGPIDVFFAEVMVMVENQQLKQNRLRLLARLQALLQGVADISLLQLPG